MGFSAKAQTNLIAGWDSNGKSGSGTEANLWGWACTNPATTWGGVNQSGTVRFMDVTSGSTMPDGSTFTGRIAMCRWDASYWGSTWTLGKGDGTSTTVAAIPLAGSTSYTFSGLVEWWSNGQQPTYSFDISTDPLGATGIIGNLTIPILNSTAKNFQFFTYTFTCPTAGNYYIVIKQLTGTASGNGTLMGLANLSLIAGAQSGICNMKADQSKVYVADSKIVADFNLDKTSDVEFSVFTVQGKLVGKEKSTFQYGKNQKVLNMELPSGEYLVKMTIDGHLFTNKVIK